MRDFPTVKIVISSTWRHEFSINQMRARFAPDIADRIIDITPQTDPDEYSPTRREQEILDWLVVTKNESAQWVALDDAAWQFHLHRDRVVACTWYIGLDEGAAARLRGALILHTAY